MCFTVYYGPSWVMDVHMVAVDDDTFIPYPVSPDRPVITAWHYQFATIVWGRPGDTAHNLDTWSRKAGLAVQRSRAGTACRRTLASIHCKRGNCAPRTRRVLYNTAAQ